MKLLAAAITLFSAATSVLAGGSSSIQESSVTHVDINTNLVYNASLGTCFITNSRQMDVIVMTAEPYPNLAPTDPLNNLTIVLKDTESERKYRKAFDLFDANGDRVRSDIVIDPTVQGKGSGSKVYMIPDLQATSVAMYGLSRGDIFGTLTAAYQLNNMNALKPGFIYTIDWQYAK